MKMNKQVIELNIELLKGDVDGFKALLAEQPHHPMGGSIEHQIDALEMAISALEHQLTNGWIPVDSLDLMRKINNGIAEVCNEHPYKVVGDMDTYSQYNEGWNDACDRIQSKITDILFEQSLPEPYKEVSE